MNQQVLEKRVRQVRQNLDRRVGQYSALEKQKSTLESQIIELKTDIDLYDKAVIILNSIAEERQNRVQQQIEDIVTRGLQTIFGTHLSFHVVQTKTGNRSEVDFMLRTQFPDGSYMENEVMQANGGGVSAVVGFLIQAVYVLLSGIKDKLLKLDEIFAHLSQGFLEPMAEFIRELVDNTDLRVLMITHQEEFSGIADKLYKLTQVDGVIKVKEISHSDNHV